MNLILVPLADLVSEINNRTIDELSDENFLRQKGYMPIGYEEDNDAEFTRMLDELVNKTPDTPTFYTVWRSLGNDDVGYALSIRNKSGLYSPMVNKLGRDDLSRNIALIALAVPVQAPAAV